jgi:ABC-2 type transport system ATP-binding protein
MSTNIQTDTGVAIGFSHVWIDRGGQTIIPDLSLSVPRGTVFGLVGPSGSGKTTVMRALLGLTPIVSGHGELLGTPAGRSSLRPCIGYMPQGGAIYGDLTGRENLEFFGGIYRVRRERVSELLEMMDLTSVADRPVGTYSGGQRQRVGLAAALLHAPPILILDEPTVGLDPRLRRRLWSLFAEWARGGTTLLVSTHVMDEAEKCDDIAFLLEGRLVATGSPETLRRQTETQDLEAAVLRLSESELLEMEVSDVA